MNERERREWRATQAIVRKIQQDIHAIYEKYNSDTNQQQPPKSIIIAPGSELPPPVTEYYATENSNRPENTFRERIRLVLEFAAFGAAIVAAFFTYRTLNEVKRQADSASTQVGIMQKQLEEADRPWIAVTPSISGRLNKNDKEISGAFSFLVKNVGRSPAENITVEVEITTDMGLLKSREQLARICGARSGLPRTQARLLGYVLFPNDQLLQPMNISLPFSAIRSFWEQWKAKEFPQVQPMALEGCVVYTYGSSRVFHQTGFAYEIVMRDGKVIPLSGMPISPNDLTLMAAPTGGYFAN